MPETSELPGGLDETYDYSDVLAEKVLDNQDVIRISRAGDESWDEWRLTYHMAPLFGDESYDVSVDVEWQGDFEQFVARVVSHERYARHLEQHHYQSILKCIADGDLSVEGFATWLARRIDE